MKKLLIPFMALFLVVSLGSCDKVADLADVDVELNLSSDEIDLEPAQGKQQGKDYTFATQEGKIDLFQGELKDYKAFTDKIRKFKATEVIIKIIKIDPKTGVHFSNPSVVIIESAGGKKVTLDLSGKELMAGSEIVVSGDILKVINEILNERKEFSYKVTGGFDQDATAKIKVNFKGKVTVNLLKQ